MLDRHWPILGRPYPTIDHTIILLLLELKRLTLKLPSSLTGFRKGEEEREKERDKTSSFVAREREWEGGGIEISVFLVVISGGGGEGGSIPAGAHSVVLPPPGIGREGGSGVNEGRREGIRSKTRAH